MIAVKGVYENGEIRLDKRIQTIKPIKVIVTFLDEELTNDSKRLITDDFTFLKSREISKRFKGSLSDTVIDERKEEL